MFAHLGLLVALSKLSREFLVFSSPRYFRVFGSAVSVSRSASFCGETGSTRKVRDDSEPGNVGSQFYKTDVPRHLLALLSFDPLRSLCRGRLLRLPERVPMVRRVKGYRIPRKVCICMYAQAFMHVHKRGVYVYCIKPVNWVFVCIYIRTYTHTHTHIYIYIYIYVSYIHTFIHTHD